jgi:hypothetical protein
LSRFISELYNFRLSHSTLVYQTAFKKNKKKVGTLTHFFIGEKGGDVGGKKIFLDFFVIIITGNTIQ